jgi:hypothetical protein
MTACGPLNRAGFRCMVSGSVSSIFYGESRLTSDVDIVLTMRRHQAKLLASAFPEPDFYLPPPEVIEAEVIRRQRGHLNIIHSAPPKWLASSAPKRSTNFGKNTSFPNSRMRSNRCCHASPLGANTTSDCFQIINHKS